MIERSCPESRNAKGRFSNPEESDCMLDTFESPAFGLAEEGDARVWDAVGVVGYSAAGPTDSDDPEDEILDDDDLDEEDDDDDLFDDEDDLDDDDEDLDDEDDEDDDDEDDEDDDDFDDDLDDDLIDLDDEFDTEDEDRHKGPGHMKYED